jgi:hypothetical protein
MADVHCFTSASFAYLDRIRVLVATLRRHHPDWIFWLCLSDREPPGFVFDRESIDHVVRIEELGVPNLPGWIFQHDVVELCTAVKGLMLRRLLDGGADKVIFLDPDIAVFGRLDEAVELLDRHDIVLTPHQLAPDERGPFVVRNEIASLKHGTYNLGFLAVANRDEGQRFASWWRDRLIDYCFRDIPNGLFTDQRWCDLAPGFFPSLHILRHPGYNVARWNLTTRQITIEEDGSIRAAGEPLTFYHFTKVSAHDQAPVERYSQGRIEIFELMHWYRSQLAANAPAGVPSDWWAYGVYDDGSAIPKEHRVAYRDRPELRKAFPNPFAAGLEVFATRMALAAGASPSR